MPGVQVALQRGVNCPIEDFWALAPRLELNGIRPKLFYAGYFRQVHANAVFRMICVHQ